MRHQRDPVWPSVHLHRIPGAALRLNSPKISVTEAKVVLQHLPRAKRYFLTEQHHHCRTTRASSPSANIPEGHMRRNAPPLFPGIWVYWIYSFSKQCSHDHKLQENFMALNASRRRHSTSDPRTVKATAGTYKTAEKRCLASTLETGRWNGFTAPRQRKPSASYSSQQRWGRRSL